MKELHLKPIGDVCGRMLAVAGGYNMAIDQCRKYVIYWDKEKNMNSDLKRFFTFSDVEMIYRDKYSFPAKWFAALDYRPSRAHKQSDFRFYQKHFEELLETYSLEQVYQGFDFLMATPSIYIETSTRFYSLSNYVLKKIFQPHDLLIQEANKVKEILGEEYVSLHITRKTYKTFDFRPLEDVMHQYLEDHVGSDIKIFFTTDYPDSYARFKERYGERIFAFENNKNGSSEKGVQNVLVDAFAMSQSKHIFIGVPTTMSEFASIYGNKPLSLVSPIYGD